MGTPLPNEGRISERISRSWHSTKPATRPANPRFFFWPLCQTPPYFSLEQAVRCRPRPVASPHRVGKAKLKAADRDDARRSYRRSGRIPHRPSSRASDTRAVEMAMWSLLGARPCTMIAWESFGEGWVTDAGQAAEAGCEPGSEGRVWRDSSTRARSISTPMWLLPGNGTNSGVRAAERRRHSRWTVRGLTICDATSAAFAQDLPGTSRCHPRSAAKGDGGRKGGHAHAGSSSPRRGGAAGKATRPPGRCQNLPA